MVLTIDTAAKISIDFIDCKWLDLDKVCLRYIDPSREEFSGINILQHYRGNHRLSQSNKHILAL